MTRLDMESSSSVIHEHNSWKRAADIASSLSEANLDSFDGRMVVTKSSVLKFWIPKHL